VEVEEADRLLFKSPSLRDLEIGPMRVQHTNLLVKVLDTHSIEAFVVQIFAIVENIEVFRQMIDAFSQEMSIVTLTDLLVEETA
jgi:hypothetical protein